MDRYIREGDDVGKVESMKPYLSWAEREAFARANKQLLYDSLYSRSCAAGSRPNFVVHVPFTEEEHLFVLQYLTVYQFIDLDLPYHNIPEALSKALPSRSIRSILNYFGDLITRGSSSRDTTDTTIVLSPPINPPFQQKFSLTSDLNLIDALKDYPTISSAEEEFIAYHITEAAFLFCASNSRSLVVDFSAMEKDRMRYIYTPDPLFNSGTHPLVALTGDGKVACFIQGETIYFFDFTRLIRISTASSPSIPTYHCESFHLPQKIQSIVGSPSVAGRVAAISQNKLYVFMYLPELNMMRQLSCSLSVKHFTWMDSGRIACTTEDNSVYVASIQEDSVDELQLDQWISACPNTVMVQCQGTAVVRQHLDERKLYIHSYKGNIHVVLHSEPISESIFENDSFACITQRDGRPCILLWNFLASKEPVTLDTTRKAKNLKAIVKQDQSLVLSYQEGRNYCLRDETGFIYDKSKIHIPESSVYEYMDRSGDFFLTVRKPGIVMFYKRQS